MPTPERTQGAHTNAGRVAPGFSSMFFNPLRNCWTWKDTTVQFTQLTRRAASQVWQCCKILRLLFCLSTRSPAHLSPHEERPSSALHAVSHPTHIRSHCRLQSSPRQDFNTLHFFCFCASVVSGSWSIHAVVEPDHLILNP